jgi:hypothetical protein
MKFYNSNISLIILLVAFLSYGIFIGWFLNKPELEEVPQQEVVVEFILRNPQEGQFAIRYEVYHNDRRVGSVHTQPLTPGIYHLEVE